MSTNYFSRINSTDLSTTGNGLDQLVDTLSTDFGLRGRISDKDLTGGNQAADAMNRIIIEAIDAEGVAQDGIFNADDVRIINAYIRANHLEEWTRLHGDDEKGEETGYHLIQNDGASERYRGDNLANTVADSIYHLGFEIRGDTILNEDGDANATVQQLAEWLTQFYTDHSTTQTGLDRMTDMIMADRGLDKKISDAEIAEGADYANAMNTIIQEAIDATNATADGAISVKDVVAINQYIRTNYQKEWALLHGDDENGEETGFHLVQNDGANTRMFGENFVNTVADGIYHLGFEIDGDNILNEDGDANATLSDLADWLNYFYVDQGTTGTGLDEFVQAIKSDHGLSRKTEAEDINGGAEAANELNKILVEAIKTTGSATDNVISVEDIKEINAYIRENHLERWIELHGDDERCAETGFHLVQNDGSSIRYRGDNLINTVIDGVYHLGFEIRGDNILNEDGNKNANLGDLATWLNNFYLGEENTFGSEGSDKIKGLNVDERIWARGGNDRVDAGDGNDEIHGGDGNDRLSGGDGIDLLTGDAGHDNLSGGAGNDLLTGNAGHDKLSGGAGNDLLTGNAGHDKLSGGAGNDQMNGGSGNDRMSGNDGNDILIGEAGKDRLSGGSGNDKLYGGDGKDRISAGKGDDIVEGGEGNDRLSGGDGIDRVDGGNGDDRIYGGSGEDVLIDGEGSDYLRGGDGDDALYAVADGANDRLKGGSGADSFHFQAEGEGIGNDLIYGFSSDAGDTLVIGGADVSYELLRLNGHNTLVNLANSAGDSLGSIRVKGAFSADDIVVAEDDFAGIGASGQVEIA